VSIRFRAERGVSNPEAVWRRLASVADMPRYWGGHRAVRVLGRRGSAYLVEVVFAFPGPFNRGVAEVEVDEVGRAVVLRYLRGPFRGVVRNYVAGGRVVSEWDVVLGWWLRPLRRWLASHFRRGAERALERLEMG